MKTRKTALKVMSRGDILSIAFLLTAALTLEACGTAETEPQPVVTVQATAAKRGPIALTIPAEAVVSPLQQAIITPKISSTIKKFYVQRGSA